MTNTNVFNTSIKQGDHCCSIYNNTEQQFSIIIPFIIKGLENGEKCLFIVDESIASNINAFFKDNKINLNTYIDSGQFSFLTKEESYLKEGYFDPDQMLELLKSNLHQALDEGYSGLRVTGEMTWVFSILPGVERLMEYEAKLNELIPNSKITAICQYNENRFTPEVLIDVLRTHPKVFLYGDFYNNNHYESPDIFLARLEGKITRDIFQNAVNDIKKINETEKALVESDKELLVKDQTIASSINAIAIADLEGKINYVNQSFVDMWGYHNKQEILGRSVLDFWEEPDKAKEVVIELEQKGSYIGELVARLTDNSFKDIHLSASMIYGEDGKPESMMASFIDITERKKAEEQLLKSEQRLNTLISQTPAAIYSFNMTDGIPKLTYVSENVKDLFGYEPEFFIIDKTIFQYEANRLRKAVLDIQAEVTACLTLHK